MTIERILTTENVPDKSCAYCTDEYLFPPSRCAECGQYYCDKYACNDKHDKACSGSMVWGD
jgi:hypothetical protein